MATSVSMINAMTAKVHLSASDQTFAGVQAERLYLKFTTSTGLSTGQQAQAANLESFITDFFRTDGVKIFQGDKVKREAFICVVKEACEKLDQSRSSPAVVEPTPPAAEQKGVSTKPLLPALNGYGGKGRKNGNGAGSRFRQEKQSLVIQHVYQAYFDIDGGAAAADTNVDVVDDGPVVFKVILASQDEMRKKVTAEYTKVVNDLKSYNALKAKPEISLLDVHYAALDKSLAYMRVGRSLVFKHIQKAEEHLTDLRKMAVDETVSFMEMRNKAMLVVTRFVEVIDMAANLCTRDISREGPVKVLEGLINLENTEGVTPETIVTMAENVRDYVKPVETEFPEIPSYKPFSKNGREYKCTGCGTDKHTVGYCHIFKCGKCGCGGLNCKGAKNGNVCDPLELKHVLNHFFFLELAKLTVESTVLLQYFDLVNCPINACGIDEFQGMQKILIANSHPKATIATQRKTYAEAVQHSSCQRFLQLAKQAYEEQSAPQKTAAELLEEKRFQGLLNGTAHQYVMAHTNAEAASVKSAAKEDTIKLSELDRPSAEVIQRTLTLLGGEENAEENSDESEDETDGEDGDAELDAMFGERVDNRNATYVDKKKQSASSKERKKKTLERIGEKVQFGKHQSSRKGASSNNS